MNHWSQLTLTRRASGKPDQMSPIRAAVPIEGRGALKRELVAYLRC